MRRAAQGLALLVAACSTGYRTEEDSRKMRAEIDDRTIESRIRVALASDPATRGVPIDVACASGTVYLRGSLPPSARAAERARELAAGVEGVVKVVVRFGEE